MVLPSLNYPKLFSFVFPFQVFLFLKKRKSIDWFLSVLGLHRWAGFPGCPERGRSLLRWVDLSPRWSLGSWGCGSQALEWRLRSCGHGLHCSSACRISLHQGLNPCLLHWQVIIYHRASRKAPSRSSLDLKEIPLFSLSPSTSFWPPCPYFSHKFLWLLSLFVPDMWQPPSSSSWGRGINKKKYVGLPWGSSG